MSVQACLKVYSRIHEPAGHVIYRINRELIKRAPESVEFVDHPKSADLQIVQCLGAGSLTKIWNKRFVLLQHCLRSSDIELFNIWRAIFSQATMVVSYINIPEILKYSRLNFHLTPWGVNTDIFQNHRYGERRKAILTSGWSCAQEAIRECHLAARQCGKASVNLGADFQFGGEFTALSRLTDQELCRLYNECEFVSGLRFKEGFEVSVIEGLACGCRPICFDIPGYKEWFADMAVYVPHCKDTLLVDKLGQILSSRATPVSENEHKRVKEMFNWQGIANAFWRRLFEYV